MQRRAMWPRLQVMETSVSVTGTTRTEDCQMTKIQTKSVAASTYEVILFQLCEFLTPFAFNGQTITERTDLVADLGLDSLGVMRLLQEVEDGFDIIVSPVFIADLHTVKDFALGLQRLIAQSSEIVGRDRTSMDSAYRYGSGTDIFGSPTKDELKSVRCLTSDAAMDNGSM
jgi:acyl carrier protein